MKSKRRRFCVAHIVTDVKNDPFGIEDPVYDVLVSEVKDWRLTGLPVRWEHVTPRTDGQSAILSKEGIGKVKNWWLDFTYPDSPFAVAVLMEITAEDYLQSPLSGLYDSVSLSQDANNRGKCFDVSLVRTGARKGTRVVFLENKDEINRVCRESFGYGSQYKRAKNIRSNACIDVMTCRMDGKAENHEYIQDNGETKIHSNDGHKGRDDDNYGDVSDSGGDAEEDLVAKELSIVSKLAQELPKHEAVSFIDLIDRRNSQMNDMTKKWETMSIQLRKLMKHVSSILDKQATPEAKKRQTDFIELQKKLSRFPSSQEHINASFDKLSETCQDILKDVTEGKKNSMDETVSRKLNDYYKRMANIIRKQSKTEKIDKEEMSLLSKEQAERMAILKQTLNPQTRSDNVLMSEYIDYLERAVDANTMGKPKSTISMQEQRPTQYVLNPPQLPHPHHYLQQPPYILQTQYTPQPQYQLQSQYQPHQPQQYMLPTQQMPQFLQPQSNQYLLPTQQMPQYPPQQQQQQQQQLQQQRQPQPPPPHTQYQPPPPQQQPHISKQQCKTNNENEVVDENRIDASFSGGQPKVCSNFWVTRKPITVTGDMPDGFYDDGQTVEKVKH